MSENGAICEDCQKAMLDPETESCSKNILIIAQKNGQVMERFYRHSSSCLCILSVNACLEPVG